MAVSYKGRALTSVESRSTLPYQNNYMKFEGAKKNKMYDRVLQGEAKEVIIDYIGALHIKG